MWLHGTGLAGLAWVAAVAAQTPDFAGQLYPAFERAQCRLCHSDNGVASTTRLQFPPENAPPGEVEKFSYRLVELVDRARPEQSPCC